MNPYMSYTPYMPQDAYMQDQMALRQRIDNLSQNMQAQMAQCLEEQLEREKASAKKDLNMSNLQAMYMITSTLCNMKSLECESVPGMIADASENLIKKYSNGKYDKNIDALYDQYIMAKEMYQQNGDQAHRDKLMESVGKLMVEVYDMLSSMVMDSDFAEERKEIQRQIKKLAEM